jgi:hypothetical protein
MVLMKMMQMSQVFPRMLRVMQRALLLLRALKDL